MKLALLAVLLISLRVSAASPSSPINQALAATPQDVMLSLPSTAGAMDGGSILNELKLSDGRLYTLSLDFPFQFDTPSDKLRYYDIHFTIFVPGDWPHREELGHGSSAERRLIQLLQQLIDTTRDPHQKKNGATLITFLRDRKHGFPAGRKYWDFTARVPQHPAVAYLCLVRRSRQSNCSP